MAASLVASSFVHTTGTSGSLGAAVQSGDVIVVVCWDVSGRHSTASDGTSTYAEQNYIQDFGPAITQTVLTAVAGSGYTPSITISSGSYFDAFALRGLSNGTKHQAGSRTGDFATNPVLISPSITTTVECALVMGYANISDNWTSWNNGGAAAITNLNHSAAEKNASGYALSQSAASGLAPGYNSSGGGARSCVTATYLPVASAASVTYPQLERGLRGVTRGVYH